jgi:hypothetical protein
MAPNPAESSTTDVGSNEEPAAVAQVDQREQLFNQGDIGPIERVSRSAEEIVSLRGIMLDIDPQRFNSQHFTNPNRDVATFFRHVIAPMIGRHHILKNMEVRGSGTGLHGIVWFDKLSPDKTDRAKAMVVASFLKRHVGRQLTIEMNDEQRAVVLRSRGCGQRQTRYWFEIVDESTPPETLPEIEFSAPPPTGEQEAGNSEEW